MVIMTQGMQAYLPLGTTEKLGNPECPLTYSIIYGDEDWMRLCDDDYGKICVEKTKMSSPNNQFFLCTHSGHNLHMDNAKGLSEVMKVFFLGHKIESEDFT